MSIDLCNKAMVITGGSSGIGAATAEAAAGAGMKVVIAARRLHRLEEVVQRITSRGGQALAVRCDVREDTDVRHLFSRTLEAFGRVDVVFANAGYGLSRCIADASDAEVRDLLETNFHGTLRCIREATPLMRQRRQGHILICTSAASEISLPWFGYYAATKAAQDSVGGSLRAELHHLGIHVTTVHPIGTRTEFFETAARISGADMVSTNTPGAMMQDVDVVVAAIMKCLRRPCPEVWPHVGTRFGVALTTAVPRLAAWTLSRMARRIRRTLPGPAPT